MIKVLGWILGSIGAIAFVVMLFCNGVVIYMIVTGKQQWP